MNKVMAQGTFDVLHPGHLHYFRESARLGDELIVVIARDSRVSKRKDLVFSENERKEMVEALEVVEKAVLGSEDNIYSTVERVDPDVITLGYDQGHDKEDVVQMAEKAAGKKVKVVRISEREDYSSSDFKASSG